MTARNRIIIFLFIYHVTSVVATDSARGNHIVVGCYEVPPILKAETDVNGNKTYSGIIPETMNYMFNQRQNLSYSIMVTEPKEIAKHGLAQAAFNQAVDKQVDIVVTGHVPTVARMAVADIAYPYHYMKYRLMQPYPHEESRLWAAIKPFQPAVWLTVVVSFGVVVVFLTLLFLYENRSAPIGEQQTFRQLFSLNAIYAFTIIIGQGNSISSKKLFIRIVAGVWCLMCIILANSFSGQLTSFLTTPIYEPLVDSFEGIAESKTLNLVVEWKSVMGETFLNAKTSTFQRLGDSLRAHPENYPKTRADLEKRFYSYQVIYPGIDVITTTIVDADWKANGKKKCGLTLSKQVPYFQYLSFILSKDNAWTDLVNKRVLRMNEHGLTDRFIDGGIINVNQCLMEYAPTTRRRSLQLNDLSITFIILGFGTGLSLIVFIIENALRFRSRRISARNNNQQRH